MNDVKYDIQVDSRWKILQLPNVYVLLIQCVYKYTMDKIVS